LEARASCREAATAVQILAMDGSVPRNEALEVGDLLSRSMRMFTRLLRPQWKRATANQDAGADENAGADADENADVDL
jgi:hypothetical protein